MNETKLDQCASMKDLPFVSVIMAAYDTNQEFFEEAVGSILGQTYGNFEFLIVDDGLSEENRAWLGSVGDERLRVIVNDENLGQSRSVNRALGEARGRYVVRMDADDVAVPTRIERQVAFMEADPDLIAAGAQVRFLGTDKVRPRPYSCDEELRATLALRNALVHPTMILRLDALFERGIRYDVEQRYAQDYMLWVDLCTAGKIALQPEILLEYRIHGGQITSKKGDAQRACADQARLKYLRSTGVDATLRQSELLGRITNEALSAAPAELDEVCHFLIDAARRDDVSLDASWVERIVASRVLRSVLYNLRCSGGIRYLAWPRFWAALFKVSFWPYYINAIR
ncbi:glycosyltransferase family 2 protein [Schaalia naturae]|uniref:Glycosyltransferase family 2 protein n=1 Tax=Schaalia naturae TaxID=635203 RepID=A0ABW2SJX9_9ACTO